jgi:hypothetical protein
MFVAAGVDYHFERLHLTPGIIFGVQKTATLSTPSTVFGGNNPSPGLTGGRTVVIRDVNQLSVLPTGKGAVPVYSAKANAKLDFSDNFSAVAEVYYTYDYNRTTFRDSEAGIAEPVFEKPNELGFNAIIQARF